jgi:hypothetical protein
MIKRISTYSLTFLLITTGTFGARSFAAPSAGQDDNNQSRTEARRPPHNTSRRRHVASKEGSKLGQRTIIFVGGKKGRNAAAKSSNPRQAKRVNADLNPQPIPPGKQRQPR